LGSGRGRKGVIVRAATGRAIAIGIIAIAGVLATSMAVQGGQDRNQPAIRFGGVEYYFRWSEGNQYEFTPRGQSNLGAHTDMVTIVAMPNYDADELAAWANRTVDLQERIGSILKTSSVPAAQKASAEHFIAAMLAGNGVVEGSFARFVLLNDVGYSIVYTHRGAGANAGPTVGAWISENGEAIEAALMQFGPIPGLDALERLRKAGPSTK
jgi:hypothetical protein